MSIPKRSEYEARFAAECANEYPALDAFEQRIGFAVDRKRLERAGRILNCPVKVNPPNWQHGRVIYALARRFLSVETNCNPTCQCWLDIGTAKGLSACVMAWAMSDARVQGSIYSLDVVPPDARVQRNSIVECDGILRTVDEIAQPFIPLNGDVRVIFMERQHWHPVDCIPFAFVDGKHTEEAVVQDIRMLKPRQNKGHIIIFDDVQIPGVEAALDRLGDDYAVERVEAKADRIYAVATRVQ